MFFDPFYVFETQFGLNDFHVAKWVHIALDVDDFGIIKCAYDLEDAIDGTNV